MTTPQKKSLVERAAARAKALEQQEQKLREQLEQAKAAQEYLATIKKKSAAVAQMRKELQDLNAVIKRPRSPNKAKSVQL